MVGTGIIIPYPCGVFYGNQTGGVNCDHPEIEGVFLPFSTDPNEKEDHLACPLTRDLYSVFVPRGWGLSEQLADQYDSIFKKYEITKSFRVDRDQLSNSNEAWLYITFSFSPYESFFRTNIPFPLDNKAILTWPNSD